MNSTAENFALNQWLTYCPDDMSYADILACMREPENTWSCEHINVWEVVETFPLDQIAEFIDDTKNAFEIATKVAPSDESHHADCPSVDGFGCRCNELERVAP